MSINVSFVNLKGGVGKTALAVNFAAYCGKNGHKTLLIDLDPQTNATFSVIGVENWQTHAKNHGTVADLLGARSTTRAAGTGRSAADVVIKDAFALMDLIPSHLELFTMDLDLAGRTARETLLKRALGGFTDDYDLVVCDCPPNLTLPTQNALALSSHYVVPISPDFLSALGVALLTTRVSKFADDLQHAVDLLGMVISRVGRPAAHRFQTVATLRDQFGDKVLKSEIRERVAVSESAEKAVPIYEMKNDDATNEFSAVSTELLQKLGV